MSANKSSNRAKFSLVKFNDIQPLIDEKKIDAYDIIYTKDTHENILIGADLSINPIRSKVYCFLDTSTATIELNKASDTYAGQIVSILENDSFEAYIVNQSSKGSFYVSKLHADTSNLDYNTLGNKPIQNLTGTLDNRIIISNLSTGIYKVVGQYKICPNDLTTYIAGNDHVFLVNQEESQIHIRKITATDIYSYIVIDNSVSSVIEIPTKEWITKQNYATQTYVDEKVAALDYMTKEDVSEYVSNVITTILEPLINEKIEAKLKESFHEVDNTDIVNLF